MMRSILCVCLLSLASACDPDPPLGLCDQVMARRVAFQAPDGVTEARTSVVPMYVGQALLTQLCDEGECVGRAYYDLSPACPIGCCNDAECLRTARRVCGEDDACVEDFVVRGHELRAAGSERLQANQWQVYEHRRAIWGAASRGSLGRRGPVSGATLFGELDGFHLVEEVPGLDTEAGQEELRNWLACGSPLVELVNPGRGEFGRCDHGSVGECVRLLAAPEAPDPTWSSIFDVVVEPFCTQCHRSGCEDDCSRLELESNDAAYRALSVGESSRWCSEGLPYLTPGDPANSVFYVSLTNDVCWGHGWQLPDDVLAPIRAWIEAGANP
ncbi:MAG: hypothetical protein H6724_17520 [Sandaracinus sp.]|nr:hypothetical protein [Myxococcales bacterium]MCB9621244.1 hypothetical protein [Sandaracinus sp.]MCB9622208.1 hypothetical protein [Sandaracinus sp.]